MKRYYIAAAALLTLYVAACSIERADARPLPAHHSVAGFGPGHCLPSGVWQATLTVTADTPNGSGHVQPDGSTGFNMAVPGTFPFQAIAADRATFTVHIRVTWPDGFVFPPVDQPPLEVTATRPADGCTVPTTSTTTCEQAIPVRDDCGTATSEVTTSPTNPSTTTIVSPSSPTSSPGSTSPVATSVDGEADTSLLASTPTTKARVIGSIATQLPLTGSSSPVVPAGIAVGIALTGCALLLIGARRKGVER